MSPDMSDSYTIDFASMNVHLPERNGHRTTSKMIWKGAEIDDYDAKSILLEKLKPKDQDVAILKPLEYLRIAESSMLEVIAYADRDEAIQQEKLSWFGERILSPSIKMETCSPRMKREMAENFRHEFLESKEESVLHFNVLSDEVTNFLMHYVFRHSVPEVVWRRKDYVVKSAKKDEDEKGEDEAFEAKQAEGWDDEDQKDSEEDVKEEDKERDNRKEQKSALG